MQLLPSDNAMQTFAFASPFMYVILMLYTKFTGLIKPFNPLYHNYNMIMQSCLLLGLTTYEYYRIAELYDIPTHNLLEISHVGSIEHQKHDTSLILTIFLISKVFEWIDTIALIVNNKKTIPLHLWHHATIGVGFYTGYYTYSGFWIGFLNSFIHIIMYAYYANIGGVRKIARYLTQLQIIQLFGGVFMNYLSYINQPLERYKNYSLINGAICLSYGVMFLDFYANKYKKKL